MSERCKKYDNWRQPSSVPVNPSTYVFRISNKNKRIDGKVKDLSVKAWVEPVIKY